MHAIYIASTIPGHATGQLAPALQHSQIRLILRNAHHTNTSSKAASVLPTVDLTVAEGIIIPHTDLSTVVHTQAAAFLLHTAGIERV